MKNHNCFLIEKWGRLKVKQKKIWGMLLSMSLVLMGCGQVQQEESATSSTSAAQSAEVSEKTHIAEEQDKEQQAQANQENQTADEGASEAVEWTYYREMPDGSLKRRHNVTGVEEEVISALSEWCAGENQLLYSTPNEWSLLENQTDGSVVINKLILADAQGQTKKVIMDETTQVAEKEGEGNFYVDYHPVGIKGDWLYLSVGKGMPYTDGIKNFFYRCHLDGSGLEKLSDTPYYSLNGSIVTDEALYYADCEMGEGYEAVRCLDLKTREEKEIEPHGKVLQLEGDILYYVAFTLEEDHWEAVLKGYDLKTETSQTVAALGAWQYDDCVTLQEGQAVYETTRIDEKGTAYKDIQTYDLK